jgi:effector-binding domain-containing protein
VIKVVNVNSMPLAVVRRRVMWPDLPVQLTSMLDAVAAAKPPGRQGGKCVVVYRSADAAGADVAAGVPTEPTFPGSGSVLPDATPSGQALTAVHTGPIDELQEARDALAAYAEANNLTLGDIAWEVLGDLSGDPDQLHAQVFQQIA